MDIISEFLALAAAECPSFTDAVAVSIETQLRAKYGGGSIDYIAKTPSSAKKKKEAAVDEAEKSGRVAEAAERYGISRATMYRLLKRP